MLIGVDLAHGLGLIMTAFVLRHGSTGVVRVISVSHGALVMHEVPSVAHPATLASPCAIVLAELLLVLGVGCECAVDDLLLGEADWVPVLLDSDGTLESSSGGEGPTGTTRSLVLDIAHLVVIGPIDIDSSVSLESIAKTIGIVNVMSMAETSAAGVVVIAHLKAVDSIDHCCVLAETKKAQVLVISEVRCPVVAEDELIRVIWVLLAVRLINDIVVVIVDLLSLSVF